MKTSVRLGISLLIMALMASAFITRATVSAKTSHPASALGLGGARPRHRPWSLTASC